MVVAGTDQDLARALSEMRQLRSTIDALRLALEECGSTLDAERRRAAAQQEADREQTRQGMEAMREQLDAAVIERREAVQAALAQSADEVAQLHATIEAMHRALAAERDDAAARRDTAERAFRAEREELHETIAVLRARLGGSDGA